MGIKSGAGLTGEFFENCFVAGTPVWVLRDAVDAEQANAALAAGADWEELAEPVAIEEVETGDYALSRPDGELGFHAVSRLYRNTTAELIEIRVYDVEDGVTETITATERERGSGTRLC